ncbi:hypothetical protein EVAR_92625_1 [Eumeta japonica]|uniref:Uncharacterized protein n=1 Tax=Eumeta variegata TaxID=151549 RepID=A0A4C1SXL3_EUMVA|nr:hypothetical protein EVAR_92625_1 [Eumeta japonica]
MECSTIGPRSIRAFEKSTKHEFSARFLVPTAARARAPRAAPPAISVFDICRRRICEIGLYICSYLWEFCVCVQAQHAVLDLYALNAFSDFARAFRILSSIS